MISVSLAEKYLPNIIYAALIIFIGLFIAFIVKKILKGYIGTHNNEMLKRFLMTLASSAIILLSIISALSKLGVPTASLVAVTGAAGLAIALSLKDFLSNIAAGFMIVFLKPFKVGDYVKINSESGTITDINLFMVSLKSSTNERLFVPNNKVITNTVLNQSYYDNRRVDLTIGVDYKTDLSQAKSVILAVLQNNAMVLDEPACKVGIKELADNSINLLVRYWTPKSNLIQSKMDLLEEITNALKNADINIPFPQMDVHLNNQ